DVPCYKIASYEATDIPLLKRIAQTGKPVIMSVGFATRDEIDESVATLRLHGARHIALLHCVSMYSDNPNPKDMNLRTIGDLRERYGVVSGFSDNNRGIEMPVLAVAAGASIIEKHFTLHREDNSFDARFSLEENEWKKMVDRIREVEEVLGGIQYGPVNSAEAYNRRFRRSLFVARDIKRGDVFTEENIRDIRPADGLETKYYEVILGRRATENVERGTPLSWSLVEGGKPKS
ncbi:MAG: N-acetylneuraminate synthase family protein, partial [Planctomycetota bacterium]